MSTPNLPWDDGRSGAVGLVAGNAALLHATKAEDGLRKVKGTIFETQSSFIVGRVATTTYLTGSNVHWANVGWDQHQQLSRQARSEQKALTYLFITAGEPAFVHTWRVPGQIVEAYIRGHGRAHAGITMAIHITSINNRYLLGDEDVTQYFAEVPLSQAEHSKLLEVLSQASSNVEERAALEFAAGAPDVVPHEPRQQSFRQMTTFDIPVAGARSVQLNVPLPLAPGDVSRIKGWVDLMSDVLVEDPELAKERARASQREWLRSQLEMGLRQLDRGEGIDGEASFERILNRNVSAPAGNKK